MSAKTSSSAARQRVEAPPVGAMERRAFATIALVHLVLSVFFILRVPLGHAPDEGAHWDYVRFLTERHALPVFGAPGVSYEAHQPPLYYLLCVPAYLLTGGNLAAGRVMSACLGVANLLCIYLGAREVFPGDSRRPLLVVSFCALLPMNLYVNAACGNDAAAGLAASATLWWLLRGCNRGCNGKSALLAGALAGGAMLCKMNAVFLVGVVAFGVLVASRAEAPARAVRLSGFATLAALVVSGPWLMRNFALYGDALGWAAFNEYFRAQSPSPQDMMASFQLSTGDYLIKAATLLWCNFWGLYGQVNSALLRIRLFGAVSFGPALVLVVGPAAYVLAALIAATRSLGTGPCRDSSRVLAVAAALCIAAFVQFNVHYFQAQARYLHMALMPLAVALVAGIEVAPPPLAARPIARWAPLFALLLLIVVLDLTVWQPILVPGGAVVR